VRQVLEEVGRGWKRWGALRKEDKGKIWKTVSMLKKKNIELYIFIKVYKKIY
jgi:hypothetical protein